MPVLRHVTPPKRPPNMPSRTKPQSAVIRRLARQIRIAHRNAGSYRVAARECQIWTADKTLDPGMAYRIAHGHMPGPQVIERLRNDGALVFLESDLRKDLIDMTPAEIIAAIRYRQPMPDPPRQLVRAYHAIGWNLQPMRRHQ